MNERRSNRTGVDSNYRKKRFPGGIEMVAVIDIGSRALRMQIAEINHKTGEIRNFESFAQAVSIGNDSFSNGRIAKTTIEDCIHVLQIYKNKLEEYGVTDRRQIRVIATSAVREATNRMAFADRVFIATGFEIERFDEAELHRVTYLGILPFIEQQPEFFVGQSLVCEVGGGTSELLLLEREDVKFAKTYRLGSLRLRKMLERYDLPVSKARSMMENQVLKTIEDFRLLTRSARPDNMVAMGGDIRFAANEINQKPVRERLLKLDVNDLGELVDEIIRLPADTLAAKYHMSLPDAKSLGPGLLVQWILAKELNVKKLLVAKVNLRDALIKEMSEGRTWSRSIQRQIVQAAIRLGRRYKFNEDHAVHVSKMACSLYDQLQPMHELPYRFRGILELAALLHDIGSFINSKSKHKHSSYLIRNSDFFGVGERDIDLIALVARYHRGATPQPRHDVYSQLDRYLRVAVAKLAAMLRIAKGLDVTNTQRIESIEATVQGNRLRLGVSGLADVSMEQAEMQQVTELFEDIFGKQVSIVSSPNNS